MVLFGLENGRLPVGEEIIIIWYRTFDGLTSSQTTNLGARRLVLPFLCGKGITCSPILSITPPRGSIIMIGPSSDKNIFCIIFHPLSGIGAFKKSDVALLKNQVFLNLPSNVSAGWSVFPPLKKTAD